MWVKVCGVTDRETAEAVADAGADAIGLVLIESPRRILPEKAAEIGVGLDVELVALIDDDSPGRALEMLEEVGATGVQPYGTAAAEIAEAAVAAGYMVLRPSPVTHGVDVASIPPNQIPLLDTHHPDLRGGVGTSFDWSLAAGLDRPFVVAGGIGADNVRQLIEQVGPWGVDASSRLESSPGRKDLELVRAYVTIAKQTALEQ